jgi:dimethylhistidine N-methyltransferase
MYLRMGSARGAPATKTEDVRSFRIERVAKEAGSSREAFEREVHRGLAQRPKTLPSMYLYDDRGSELFARIMNLPEYYLARTEREILVRHGQEIADAFAGTRCDVVDLGAGNGEKSRLLLQRLHLAGARVRYVPVDISKDALETALGDCERHLPGIDAEGLVAEYTEGIHWLSSRGADRKRLVLFLGSNVGNMEAEEATGFFAALRRELREGDSVLVGFDLVKDPRILQGAYDDRQGVTAEFNLNLLRRMNRELGADFDLSAFRHVATFSPVLRRMESYLVSLERQAVRIQGARYEFEAWEPIHTEISCKYRESDIDAFAASAGFSRARLFFDERRWFADAVFRVDGPPWGTA